MKGQLLIAEAPLLIQQQTTQNTLSAETDIKVDPGIKTIV